MSAEVTQTEFVMNVVSKSLRAKLPGTRRFIMLAIPIAGSESTQCVVRTDCAHAPKELGKILREVANHYDPQS